MLVSMAPPAWMLSVSWCAASVLATRMSLESCPDRHREGHNSSGSPEAPPHDTIPMARQYELDQPIVVGELQNAGWKVAATGPFPLP